LKPDGGVKTSVTTAPSPDVTFVQVVGEAPDVTIIPADRALSELTVATMRTSL